MPRINQETRESVRDAASEIKTKLRTDISNWSKVRRLVSLRNEVICLDCGGTGKTDCTGCAGTGNLKIVWNNETEACGTCQGTGSNTCVDCMGHGKLHNPHRKKLLWVMGIGCAAWILVLYKLWNPDLLPEQQAKYIKGGGGGGSAHVRSKPISSKTTGGNNNANGAAGTGANNSGEAPPNGGGMSMDRNLGGGGGGFRRQ